MPVPVVSRASLEHHSNKTPTVRLSDNVLKTTIAFPSAPRLATIPPELFDEIFSFMRVLPLDWYYDTNPGGFPDARCFERTVTLRAVSQTCRALRVVATPRLWSRLDLCVVPVHAKSQWFKYVMQEIQRKAKGFMDCDPGWRGYVRTLTFTLSNHDADNTIHCLAQLLQGLPSLNTIQVLNCKTAGIINRAITGITLPTVQRLVIPSQANGLVRACFNATHVRCAGGDGAALVSSLKHCKCEVFDGMVRWVESDPNVIKRLVKSAPGLQTLEIRRVVNGGLGIDSQNTAPAAWAGVIPALAGLKHLRTIILTFPREEEVMTDRYTVEAARRVLRESAVERERRLVVRRVRAYHYSIYEFHKPEQGDVLLSLREEVFK